MADWTFATVGTPGEHYENTIARAIAHANAVKLMVFAIHNGRAFEVWPGDTVQEAARRYTAPTSPPYGTGNDR